MKNKTKYPQPYNIKIRIDVNEALEDRLRDSFHRYLKYEGKFGKVKYEKVYQTIKDNKIER